MAKLSGQATALNCSQNRLITWQWEVGLGLFVTWPHLSNVESKDKVERKKVFILVHEIAENLKHLLGLLIPDKDEPIAKADESVEEAEDSKLPTGALPDATSPDTKKTEEALPAGGVNILQVGHGHSV